jgi:aspartyl protease family protein
MRIELLLFVGTIVAIGSTMPTGTPPRARPTPRPIASTASVAPAGNVTALDRAADGHFYATAEVNYAPIRFLVDTGASVVALSEADARRANIAFDPAAFTVIGRGAGGAVRGQPVTLDGVLLDGRRESGVPAVVIAGADRSLIGQSLLRRYARVEIEGDRLTLR